MDPEPYFIMGMFVGALALWLIQVTLRTRRLGREHAAELAKLRGERGPGAASDDRRRQMEDLHARLAVLERIATDPADRTASEIEKLRD